VGYVGEAESIAKALSNFKMLISGNLNSCRRAAVLTTLSSSKLHVNTSQGMEMDKNNRRGWGGK